MEDMSKHRRSLATTKGKDTSRRAKPLVEELVIWIDENNISTDALKFGTFEQKSIITTHNWIEAITDKSKLKNSTFSRDVSI